MTLEEFARRGQAAQTAVDAALNRTPMPADITIGDKYTPAMTITEQAAADAYFERCVAHAMTFGTTREEAEQIERDNLGYFAGYFDHKTRARVERLFHCAHPIFGAIAEKGAPDPEDVFRLGLARGRAERKVRR